ncbi:hypothetical protein JE959_000143 [Aeromonas veronii]|nr:hypothetical protein [Aeromonas veronii]
MTASYVADYDVDKIVCDAHYRAAGWSITPKKSLNIFSENVLIYPVLITSKQTAVTAPLIFSNNEMAEVLDGVPPSIPRGVIELLVGRRGLDGWDTGYVIDPIDVLLVLQHGYKRVLSDEDFSASFKRITHDVFCSFNPKDRSAFKEDILAMSNTHLLFIFKVADLDCKFSVAQIPNRVISGSVASPTELKTILSDSGCCDADNTISVIEPK